MTPINLSVPGEPGATESPSPDQYTGPQYIASMLTSASGEFAVDAADDLSFEDAEALANEYWPEWGIGPAQTSREPSPVHAVTATEIRVGHLRQDVVRNIQELNYLSGSEDQAIRNEAVAAFGEVYQSINPPEETLLVEGRVFSMGRRLDDWLGSRKQCFDPVDKRTDVAKRMDSVSRFWTAAGLVVSIVAALLILLPKLWLLIPLIVLARQILTVKVGGAGTLPFEGLGGSVVSRNSIYRCWATHLSDAILLTGFLAFGLFHSAPLALTATAAITVMMLGIILRLSALQLGVQITRLHLERLMRVWPPLIGLSVAALVPSHSTLALCLGVALGPIAYGVGEHLRSVIRVTHELKGQDSRAVTVLVASTGPEREEQFGIKSTGTQREEQTTIKKWTRQIPSIPDKPRLTG